MKYKKTILSNLEKVAATSIFWFITIGIVMLLNYFFWTNFQWKIVEPLSVPPLIPRLLLSALAYPTIGALLYMLRLYQILYYILPRNDFKTVKKWIWLFSMGVVYLAIQTIVDIWNVFITYFYNMVQFFISILPGLSISFLITLTLVFIYIRIKLRHENIIKD